MLVDEEKTELSFPAPDLENCETYAEAVLLAMITSLEQAVLNADLRDKAEFHGLLHLITRHIDKGLVEGFITLQQPHLAGHAEDDETKYKSQESKISRWIHKKATPGDLLTRQQIIASAFACLKNRVRKRRSFTQLLEPDIRYCRVEKDANCTGIGSYSNILN